jgi:hypothetical protein
MSITELLKRVGDNNVQVQFLHDCICGNISTDKRGITTVSFKTNAISCADFASGRGQIGIILWIPQDKMPKS